MPKTTAFIERSRFTDARCYLQCVNNFTYQDICRFYKIRNSHTTFIRAWQGYKIEHKYFCVPEGSFDIAWVEVDDFDIRSPLMSNYVIFSSDKPGILSIPRSFASGIKALTPLAILTVYSNPDLSNLIKTDGRRIVRYR